MALTSPHFHWGSREVEMTYVPESADEIVAIGRRMVGEALGVLGFTFVAGSAIVVNGITNGGLGLLGMGAAIAIAYVVMLSVFYPISGGHINPGVTVGMVAARRMPPSIGLLYIGAQFGGAILGALLLNVIYNDFVSDAASSASLAFGSKMGGWTGGFFEAILTFVLVTVYFRAFVDARGDKTMGAFAVGMVALFGFLVAFPLTGAAMNLARVFGTDLVAGQWSDFGYYWLGLIGGGAAGLLYEYIFATPEAEA